MYCARNRAGPFIDAKKHLLDWTIGSERNAVMVRISKRGVEGPAESSTPMIYPVIGLKLFQCSSNRRNR